MGKWEVEEIPDEDLIFHRVHQNSYIDALRGSANPKHPIPANVFRFREYCSLSCNWSEYSSPEDTQEKGSDSPENYGVLEFDVHQVREKQLGVIHTPCDDNQAHCSIEKTEEQCEMQIRFDLQEIVRWSEGYEISNPLVI